MREIAFIEGCAVIEEDDGRVHYVAKAAIDGDGGDNSLWGDPDYQATTSLTLNGSAINADKVPYVVVPPAIIHNVKGVVLGCKARVTNIITGATTLAVVADVGPHQKLGEISIACAKAINIPHSPLTGGVSAHVIEYELWPGVPALVNGTQYELNPQPFIK